MSEYTQPEFVRRGGGRVKERVERAVEQGNQRRVVVRRKGHKILDTSLTIAVIAVVVAPPLAAVAAVAVAFFDTTIEVHRADDVDSASTW